MTTSQDLDYKGTLDPTITVSSQKQAKNSHADFHVNRSINYVHFTDKLKYLGSITIPCLTENAKIEETIK